MKKVFGFSLFCLLALLTVAGSNARADQVLASSVTAERLTGDANLVVRAKALEVEQATPNQRRMLSLVTAEVLEVVKGNATVGTKIKFRTDRNLSKGSEFIVFLHGSGDVYAVTGLTFGVFPIKTTKDNKQMVLLGSSKRGIFRGFSTSMPQVSKSLSSKQTSIVNAEQKNVSAEDFTSILREIVKGQSQATDTNKVTK